MKKLILLSAFLFAVSLGMAQRGINSYYGHNPRGGNVGYNSAHNHGPPAMHPQAFQRAKRSVNVQNFEQDRLRVAKQIVRANALRAVQVKQLVALMSFESSRLKLAKMAYSHVIDPDRYYLVNDAFRFNSSVRELDNHIANADFSSNEVVAYGGGGGYSSSTTVVQGQHGHTTYSGGVTVTSGHGGHAHGGNVGINHGAPVIVTNSGSSACGTCQGHHVANHMCEVEFGRILRTIRKQCFDRDRILIAKQALGDKMLKTSMVIQVMDLMSFERSKLDFAKFAYHNTWDIDNYYLVNDAFTFSSSIRELDCYIRSNG